MRGDERDIRAALERAPNQTGDYPHREREIVVRASYEQEP
jgi:hypothetical protein